MVTAKRNKKLQRAPSRCTTTSLLILTAIVALNLFAAQRIMSMYHKSHDSDSVSHVAASVKSAEDSASAEPTKDAASTESTEAAAISYPKTGAFRCKEKRDYTGKYRAQSKEDKIIIDEFFDQICNGTYVEIGGLDGKTFSNSFLFHNALDWKGVLVEGSPLNYEKLVQNRPNEIATFNAGVCAEEKDLHYVTRTGAVAGFVEFAPESFQKQWWNEDHIKNALVVKCRTLKNIFREAVPDHFHFDFFSLDVEGAELEVLKSIDFDLVSFGMVFVESDEHDPKKNEEVYQHLIKNGYKSHFNHTIVARSQWFVHEKYDVIYEGIAEKK